MRPGGAACARRSPRASGSCSAHPILRKVVACTGTANLFSSMATAVEIIFLIRVLHVRPAYTGLIFAIAAIGGIAGGVLSGRMARWIGSARVIWFSILVIGAPQFLGGAGRARLASGRCSRSATP